MIFFVFPSIDWSPEGERIKEMLLTMGLRSVNVLFIDDNHLNLKDAEYTNLGTITADPSSIGLIYETIVNGNLPIDLSHKRLKKV